MDPKGSQKPKSNFFSHRCLIEFYEKNRMSYVRLCTIYTSNKSARFYSNILGDTALRSLRSEKKLEKLASFP